MDGDNEWPWSILWTDKVHFYLQNFDDTQNCRVWVTENPFTHVPVLLYSTKFNSAIRAYGIFYYKAVFFRGMGPVSHVTCTINYKRWINSLRTQVIPTLQQHPCLETIIQDALPHIGKAVMQLLKSHFGNDRNIRRHFPKPSRSYQPQSLWFLEVGLSLKYCFQWHNFKFNWNETWIM